MPKKASQQAAMPTEPILTQEEVDERLRNLTPYERDYFNWKLTNDTLNEPEKSSFWDYRQMVKADKKERATAKKLGHYGEGVIVHADGSVSPMDFNVD